MKEYRLPQTIIENYTGNLRLLKERIGLYINPAEVPPDLVRSMLHTEMILERETTDFSATDQLELLDRFEKWYTDKNLEFPNKEYLERQRAFYSNS